LSLSSAAFRAWVQQQHELASLAFEFRLQTGIGLTQFWFGLTRHPLNGLLKSVPTLLKTDSKAPYPTYVTMSEVPEQVSWRPIRRRVL
jgi:hypothetical protein